MSLSNNYPTWSSKLILRPTLVPSIIQPESKLVGSLPEMTAQERALVCASIDIDLRYCLKIVPGYTTILPGHTTIIVDATGRPAPEPLELMYQGWSCIDWVLTVPDSPAASTTARRRIITCAHRSSGLRWPGFMFEGYITLNFTDMGLFDLAQYRPYGLPPESLKNMDDRELILHFLHSVDPHITSYFNLVTNLANQEWYADLLMDNGAYGFIEADGLHVVHYCGGSYYDLVDQKQATEALEMQPDYELECWLEPRDV